MDWDRLRGLFFASLFWDIDRVRYLVVAFGIFAVGIVVLTIFGIDPTDFLHDRNAPYLIGGLIMLVVLPAIAVMFVNSRKIEPEEEFIYEDKYEVLRERTDKMLYEREEDVDEFIAGDILPQSMGQVPQKVPTGPMMAFSQPVPIANPHTPAGGISYPPASGTGLPNPHTPAIGVPGTNLVAPIVADDEDVVFPNEPSVPLVIGAVFPDAAEETIQRAALNQDTEPPVVQEPATALEQDTELPVLEEETIEPEELALSESDFSEIEESEIDDLLDDLDF